METKKWAKKQKSKKSFCDELCMAALDKYAKRFFSQF